MPCVAFIFRPVQTGTICPIAVGVRVGVNVSQRKTAGRAALTMTRGQKKREKQKNSTGLRPKIVVREPMPFLQKLIK